ncbi:hypothetical protein Tamer19_53750 [Cupriavidus sp. TA19]|uniref:hypothetical protein n=1 Tax=unclassified Cupriavidus TaxID=2640874 RepID=UPI000E2EBAB3|nr:MULTISPECIES: hypothetical protein [unclassified Cupriavidus]BDB29865.1 hypothetical protein CTP10_R72810 [Cupriavidus sp. P-10]GLC95966.1 hypothetical protein Tamer19_53750 [Cupriavidus sp. TA19]
MRWFDADLGAFESLERWIAEHPADFFAGGVEAELDPDVANLLLAASQPDVAQAISQFSARALQASSEGPAAALPRGLRSGRPPPEISEEKKKIPQGRDSGEILGCGCGVARPTLIGQMIGPDQTDYVLAYLPSSVSPSRLVILAPSLNTSRLSTTLAPSE